MSKLRDLLKHLFRRGPPQEVSIPPAKKRRTKPDWRIKAHRTAAERHGKAFKVGPDHLAREVMVAPGQFSVAKPGEQPAKAKQEANVTPIAAKKARQI